MDKILHDLKDSKLWELWYILYNGSCRILSINSIIGGIRIFGPSKQGLRRSGVQCPNRAPSSLPKRLCSPRSGWVYKIHPELRLMAKILHDLKDSKQWELWYIPYNG